MYSKPAVECVVIVSSKRIDEVMARGFFVALPLSYSHHFGKGDWWDSNPRPTAEKAWTPNRQSIHFRAEMPQRNEVETMRLGAQVTTKVM